MRGIPCKEHQSIRSPFPMFFPRHPLKITGSLEVVICFNSGKRTKTVSNITNFTVKFPGSGEIAGVSLPEVLVMRLTLENHLQDQNASLSDKYHRQPAGLSESTFWPSTAILMFTQPHGISVDYLSLLILTISINLFQYLTPCTPLRWHPLDRYYLPRRHIGIAGLSATSLCFYSELTLGASFTLLSRQSNIWKMDTVSLLRH